MYYHVSPVEGLTELEPHVPYDAEWGEPDTPRVCAAPTFEQCMLGTGDFDVPVVLYAIGREPDVDNAGVIGYGGVHDAVETGEVWYLSPVPCREAGRMEIDWDTCLWKYTVV